MIYGFGIKYTIIILSLLLLIIAAFPNSQTLSQSPSIVRHEMVDAYNDVLEMNTKFELPSLNRTLFDIIDSTYYSDGKFLYGTIWLRQDFTQEMIEQHKKYLIRYGILIDVDSDNQTHFQF